MRLLCLSNGHGEDIIAVRILKALQEAAPDLRLEALPLVGEGRAYASAGMPVIGPVQTMPSGGFVYMDGKQLARDVQGGLLKLTMQQFKAIKAWKRQESALGPGGVLAVGDIVPLAFSWLSGAPYGFVGTARSEYYLRDEQGVLPNHAKSDRALIKSGSVFHSLDRWLMRRPNCQAVYPRDGLTSRCLQNLGVSALDLGNPMMDGLAPTLEGVSFAPEDQTLKVLLLPGSRPPEAYENWESLLWGVRTIQAQMRDRPLLLLGAIASSLDLGHLTQSLTNISWTPTDGLDLDLPPALIASADIVFTQNRVTLLLSKRSFNDYLHLADIALAMAGTATEQFVGLGKPVVTIAGQGPQFTYAFAEAQTRLLGPSVTLVNKPDEVGRMVELSLKDPDRLRGIGESGQRRMGPPGAAARMAQNILDWLPR
jgi:uncharacterized protein (TIGR03492 family)